MPNLSAERIESLVDPVFIIGMHRSGTTMIAELLADLGLFLGDKVQGDHEAVYFLRVNETILEMVNGAWDNVTPIHYLLRHPDLVDMTVKCLRGDLLSRHAREFLGNARWRKYGSVEKLDSPWGWKDPRMTFMLPLWLKLFPNAKLINIIRNGVDVAASLQTREEKLLEVRKAKFERRYSRLSTRPRIQRAGFHGSARCLYLDGGFSLWEEYVRHAEGLMEKLPNRKISFRYEDFLASPREHLRTLVEFCELPGVSEQQIELAAGKVKAERGNAFLAKPALAEFYQKIRHTEWMRRYGYDALG